MITWQDPFPDGTQHATVQLSDGSYASGYARYADEGGYEWKVFWSGHQIKTGTGCSDRKEARRAVEGWLEKIVNGECDPPWRQSADRQALEARLLAAQARDAKPTLYFNFTVTFSFSDGSKVSDWIEDPA